MASWREVVAVKRPTFASDSGFGKVITRSPHSKNLPWIHDAVRVERLLDRTHHIERRCALVVKHFVALESTDAVLGAEAAAVARDQVMHGSVDARREREKLRGGLARRLIDIEVQVAVAKVTVRNETTARCDRENRGGALDDEPRQFGCSHRDGRSR